MIVNSTQCCAVMELSGIASYNEPKQVVTRLCQTFRWNLAETDRWGYKQHSQPYAFYTFTSVERLKGTSDPVKIGYGKKLAEFIKANRLGEVKVSHGRYNRVNHPTHWVRVYVWSPHPKRLKEWYEKVKNESV
jgi:hypothetical protein